MINDVIFLVEPCGLFFVKKKCFGIVLILSWELISDLLVDESEKVHESTSPMLNVLSRTVALPQVLS